MAGKRRVWILAHDGTNRGFRFSGPEGEGVFASHRKNVEAMMQVNRLALDGFHAVWRYHLDFIQESVGELTTRIRGGASPPGPLSAQLARYVEYSNQAFEKTLENAHELTDLVNKATGEAMNVINKRVCEGVGEWWHSSKKRSDETTRV